MNITDNDIHKLNWLKTIFNTGKWYLLSSLFSKGISFFLLPIYTRYLNPSEYGVLNSLNSVAQLLPIFISLYLDSAFGRFFHEKKKDHEQLKDLFSTIYWFVLIYGAIIVFLSLISSPLWMNELLNVPVWPYAYLAFIPPLFFQIGQLGIIFLRQNLESRQTTVLEIATTSLMVVTTLPLLMICNMGVIAKLIGTACQACFLFIYYTIYFSRKDLLRFTFNKKLLINCLSYSVPLIPNIAGGWITSLSDRLIIAKYTDLASVGLYSFASQIAMLLYIAQDAITQVTGPISISGLIHDKEATKEKMTKLSLLLWGLMLFANLFLFFFSKEITSLLSTKDYSQASKIIGIMGLTYVLSCQYRIFSNIISYHKKTWIITAAGILMALSSFVLNLVLVPIYGYRISAIVQVVATFIYTSFIFIWAKKLEQLKMHWFKSILILVIFLCCIISSSFFKLEIALIIKIGLFIIFGGSIFLIFNYKRKVNSFKKILTK